MPTEMERGEERGRWGKQAGRMLNVNSSHASAAQHKIRVVVDRLPLGTCECPAGVGVWLMMSHSALALLAFWYVLLAFNFLCR